MLLKADEITSYVENRVVKLEGKKLEKVEGFKKPKKYYVFHLTASWCGTCKTFTPKVAEFSNEYKRKYGSDFELITLTFDRKLRDQEKYSVKKGVTWLQLNYEDSQELLSVFKDKPTLPNLVVFSADGKFMYSKESLITDKNLEDQALVKIKALLDK